MAEPAELRVRLSPDVKRIVDDAVEFGDHASPDAVVEEALHLWQQRREDRLIEAMGGVDALQKLYDDGIASGSAGPLDIEAVIGEARRRFHEAAE